MSPHRRSHRLARRGLVDAALIVVAVGSGLSVATWNGLWIAEVAALSPGRVSEATAGATFFLFGTYVVVPPVAGLVIAWFGYRAAFGMVAACVLLTGIALVIGWRGQMRRSIHLRRDAARDVQRRRSRSTIGLSAMGQARA